MNNKKQFFVILVLFPFLLLGCAKGGQSEGVDDSKEYFINPVSPVDNGTVSLANDDVTEFINNYTFTSSSNYVEEYNHYESKTYLSLSWTSNEAANYYVIEFSEDE